MRLRVIVLSIALAVTVSACARRNEPPPEPPSEGSIDFVRNSEFSGPRLRVFLTLEGRPRGIRQHDRRCCRFTARSYAHSGPSGTGLDVHQGRGGRHVGGVCPGELGRR